MPAYTGRTDRMIDVATVEYCSDLLIASRPMQVVYYVFIVKRHIYFVARPMQVVYYVFIREKSRSPF